MTLIELLIVIVILSVLTAAALPVLTPSTTERRIREASRELNTYLAQAQSKAIATQRPYGVALKRLSSDTGRAEDRGVCLEVFMVEQPVPYAGFDENSRVRVALNIATTGGNPPVPGYNFPTVLLDFVTRTNQGSTGDSLPPGWDGDLVPAGLLRPGDVVEVQGNRYRLQPPIVGDTSLAQLDGTSGYFQQVQPTGQRPLRYVAVPLNDTGQVVKPVADERGWLADPNTGLRLSEGWLDQWQRRRLNHQPFVDVVPPAGPLWTQPAPYKILRQPVTTSAPPLQLPEAIAVDLEASGIVGDVPFHWAGGNSLYSTPVDTPVYILFSPEGSIERVQYDRVDNVSGNLVVAPRIVTPSSSVSLLVGRRELIPAQPLDLSILSSGNEAQREEEKNKVNWLNMESRWVTIGAQTGSVVTTENAFVNMLALQQDISSNRVPDRIQPSGIDPLDIRLEEISRAQEFAREMRRLGGR